MSDSIEISGDVLDGWHARAETKWNVSNVDVVHERAHVEHSAPLVATRPTGVRTFTITLERDTEGGHERQTVTVQGYVMVADPPTLLLAFPLEES